MADAATTNDDNAFSFVEMEHQILKFWETEQVFQKSLDQTRGNKPYIFYDGPPFATGLPHHGHVVASTIKDIVPRYWTMKGRYVMRRFGWDCHGLPIEHEIDKQLNMSAAQAVEELGVAGYNDQCRAIVQRYVAQWRETITRLGRWIDFDNDYKTMDLDFMESVWWVLKQLWDKELVYEGVKVMPLSTALGTPLSNFEANSNYMDVQDPAVTVLFKLADEDAYLTAWTTTPWTLPSNLAVCVGPKIEYLKVKDPSLDKPLYLAAERVGDYLKEGEYEVLERMSGEALVGKRYEPLFPYFAEQAEQGAFVVISGDYVTTDSGSGLVHQAPAFGEDDYQAFRKAGLDAFACPVDMHGLFTAEVSDFAGMHVKEADKHIIRHLKEHGALYRQDTVQHSYPFCYRSDTPLIYRAVPSWYVRVSEMHDKLINANAQVRWVPDHIKEGRFGNWIAGAMDWSISRNRVWGTPLPIWINDETGNQHCVGSVEELAQLTGTTVTDLHREHVDPLTFTKDGEPGTYRRISEVLDCWFESGSMPYAQLHYPFENKDVFEAGFPAEFIAEGLDQTRGWFYTLTVLAAALYDKPAFKNVIVNGMVLAEDGKKMSKRLRNYTPPDELMESFGADALRLYLINSGLVKAEEQRFTDSGVRDMTRRALLPAYNAFSFLKTYADIDQWSPDKGGHRGDNVLDRWITSRLQTLKANVAREMEAYRLYNVVPELFAFIEDLTNWYIRLNRTRYWGEGMDEDKLAAYSTLYDTLGELATVIAPFTPFLSEYLYRELAGFGGSQPTPISVHLCDYPEPDEGLIDTALEDAVDRARQVILLGRQKREEVKINLRTPLACLTIVHRDADTLEQIKALEDTIRGELNVQQVRYDTNESNYIELVAKPNFPVLGKRLGKRMKSFAAAIKQLSVEQIAALQAEGNIELDGERFDTSEIEVLQRAQPGTNVVSNRLIAADLDCNLTPELIRGGYAREVQNRIQQTRKEIGLHVADRIEVGYSADGELAKALSEHGEFVASQVLATRFDPHDGEHAHQATIDGQAFSFSISKVSATD